MHVLPRNGLPPGRQWAGAGVAVVVLPVLTTVLTHERSHLTLATPVLLVLLLVLVVALIGGLRPAVPTALLGGLALNYFFTPPLHRFSVAHLQDLVVLGVFLAVAVSVSVVVDLAARRTAQAARAAAEAEALSTVAGTTLGEQDTLPALLDRVLTVFSASEVSMVERVGGVDVTVAVVGRPAEGDVEQVVPAGADASLVVRGPELFAADRRVLEAFAEAGATALSGRRLAAQASQAEAVDRLRTALLAAVGHDLRTPLAGVKIAVSSLRSDDVAWSKEEADEFLATIEESADRLQGLVSNLLDASRLQAGALSITKAAVSVDLIVARALVGIPGRELVKVDVPEDLELHTDAGLLERVVGNLVDNALRHDPVGVEIIARSGTLAVVDHGPGMAEIPAPFGSDRGVGLGLFVVQGFVEALGGTLTPSVSDGGGLTMTVVLPA